MKALELPFNAVGEVVEFVGADADYERYKHSDSLPWLLRQAVEVIWSDDDSHFDVTPEHVIAFSTNPGEGCNAASFGLALHPANIHTGLHGWSWSGHCRTVSASNSGCGGMENFLRCHLAIVKLLDHADELGIVKEVLDEGTYWEKRNIQELAAEVTRWNCLLVGVTDQSIVEAEIAKLPNYEYLEA